MYKPNHAYCNNCKTIRPVFQEDYHKVKTVAPGKWCAADIVCNECFYIIAVLYHPQGRPHG